jgi:nicotinate phosphoribosyltransferase
LSEQTAKVSNPGSLQVRRFEDNKEYLADMIYDELAGEPTERVIVDIANVTLQRRIPPSAKHHDLLVPIFRHGERVYDQPSIAQIRTFAQKELGRFYAGVKRLLNPHVYPVGLEIGLHTVKSRLIQEVRSGHSKTDPPG